MEAERRAAARAAEAEAKARALAAGQIDPTAVIESLKSPRPNEVAAAAFAAVPAERGDVNSAIAELQNCSADHPVTLYLNALIRDGESMKLTSLADVREGTNKIGWVKIFDI